jgi:cholesterol oxidase
MGRLARPLHQMRAHYSVVVVGSGYGGAITACRVAEAGHDVCVLERGREMHPGEYPDRLAGAVRHTQARTRGLHIGDPRALFDFHLDGDMNVLVGCWLGGTSLINANVAAVPDERVFQKDRWPHELREFHALTDHYERARQMLNPQRMDALPIKSRALAAAAKVSDGHDIRPHLNITFEKGHSSGGVPQEACTGCGDCITGCNVGAKNTVLMNYLPRAYEKGAHIFTEVEVRTVRESGGIWLVTYRQRGGSAGQFDGPTRIVTADAVVLSAGTLGTTEILLRSAAAGLPMSKKVGHHFSGNGDVLAFGYDELRSVNGIGVGQDRSLVGEPPGPCISAMVTVDDGRKLGREVVVEDAVIPRALASILRPGLALSALVAGKGKGSRRIRWAEILFGAFRSPYRGPSDHTQTFLVMSHDGDGGHLVMSSEHDRVQVDWPGAGSKPPYPRANRILRRFTKVLGGTFVSNPAWSKRMGRRLVTVHPLGGAVMADDAEHGVVDHMGRVFKDTSGKEPYEGLWVADGSMVPTPLGTNPLFTISALAERTSTFLVATLGVVELEE